MKTIIPLPTPEYLRERFERRNGTLFWRHRPAEDFRTVGAWKIWNLRFAGKRAGTATKKGYRHIILDYVGYFEHRLIFHMEVRPLEIGETIDHKSQDVGNSSPENLRACSNAQNLMNRPGWRKKPSGLPKNVYQREQHFTVEVKANGKKHYIGYFRTLKSAADAAMQARERLHGEYADHGTPR